MKSKALNQTLWAITLAVALVVVAWQMHLKRQFAEKPRQDYAEYDSMLDLSIPFVIAHRVQFSSLDQCENKHSYVFGYHRIFDTSTTISDPVISNLQH